MERSFFLKKRRADFVAGGLSGRVIVAGGLGKNRSSQLSRAVVLVLDTALEQRVVLTSYTPPTVSPQRIQYTPDLTFPRGSPCVLSALC